MDIGNRSSLCFAFAFTLCVSCVLAAQETSSTSKPPAMKQPETITHSSSKGGWQSTQIAVMYTLNAHSQYGEKNFQSAPQKSDFRAYDADGAATQASDGAPAIEEATDYFYCWAQTRNAKADYFSSSFNGSIFDVQNMQRDFRDWVIRQYDVQVDFATCRPGPGSDEADTKMSQQKERMGNTQGVEIIDTGWSWSH